MIPVTHRQEVVVEQPRSVACVTRELAYELQLGRYGKSLVQIRRKPRPLTLMYPSNSGSIGVIMRSSLYSATDSKNGNLTLGLEKTSYGGQTAIKLRDRKRNSPHMFHKVSELDSVC